MGIENEISVYLDGHFRAVELLRHRLAPDIGKAAGLMVEALRKGNKILVMGNGGSAADAQHLAAELVGRFLGTRKALPAVALTTDTSILTAVANDFGYEEVFKRQVEALAVAGDVVIGISTSGTSNNVFHALTSANKAGCTTIGLLGRNGGNIGGIVDVALTVPVQETPHIQEAHVVILHLLCTLVEEQLAKERTS